MIMSNTRPCADNDLHALLEAADVLADGGAADARHALDLEEVAKRKHDILDLLRKLAGGSQDQHLGPRVGQVNRLQLLGW
jgi:hypothetical protein